MIKLNLLLLSIIALIIFYNAESMVDLFFKNSSAFVVVDGACAAYSLVSLPMYDTFDLPALQTCSTSSESHWDISRRYIKYVFGQGTYRCNSCVEASCCY
jgi:long-subunit acyl-CoA synthetase (AMP-forming)